MNFEMVNDCLSRLVDIISGNVHAFADNGRSLSKFTVSPFEKMPA
ncbi:hypothetical protein BCM02_104167 [Paenibacillus methanolicus]|uniref:Uncharacterized protein n=1 Tax=Paenibacillus methanolicus TaxID=582686 RepID=A0A5S5CAX1_9BACL|nr:hypothetical protein BCM02_104167 [Paenibacillus methanolicus]